MSDARVLVVEHQWNAGLGQLAQPLRESGARIITVGPDAGGDVPESLAGFDGLIVLGGHMGPEEDDVAPWLPATRRLLSEGVATSTPTLGICLGGQLLAVAEGGAVDEMAGPPEIGVQTVRFADDAADDRLFGPLAGTDVPAMQWHYLEASRLPAGARLLASNAACPAQAYALGDAAWGVQFHPEALAPTAVDWIEEDPEALPIVGVTAEELVDGARRADPELQRVWGALARRFGELAGERAAARAAAG